MIILAIDPGTERSAWVLFNGSRILDAMIERNADLLNRLRRDAFAMAVAIERIEPRYGLNMGWETIRTCELVGALTEAAVPMSVALLRRSDILRHLGVAAKGAADSGVRAALMDRWGGAASVRKGGPLAGIKTHLWSALSVAVTYGEAPGLAEVVPRGAIQTDLDIERAAARRHAEYVHDETHGDPEMCGPECAPFIEVPDEGDEP